MQVIPRRGDQCYRTAKQDFPPDETGTRQCPPPAKAPGRAAQPGQVTSAHDASTVPARTGDTVTFSGTSRGLASAEVYRTHSSSASVSRTCSSRFYNHEADGTLRRGDNGRQSWACGLGDRAPLLSTGLTSAPTEEMNEESPAEQGYSVCFPILRRDSTCQLIAERTEGNRGVSRIKGAGGGRGGRVRRPGAVL